MEKPKFVSLRTLKHRVISMRFLKQHECSCDICAHEISRAEDAAVHMTLSREMHDSSRSMAGK
jgi:hypothetical protein